jgi:hypothetical protein
MLGILGALFKVQAVALFEDIPLKEHYFNRTDKTATDPQRHMFLPSGHLNVVNDAYDRAAIVSWVCAGIYFGFLVLSTVFMVINTKFRGKAKTT